MNGRMRPSLLSITVGLAALACGSETSAPAPAPGPAAAANELRIETTEFVVPAGKEIQSCYYTTLPNADEVFVRQFDATQAVGGHHVIIMQPLTPMPDGTIEDCTEGDAMVKYIPLVLSSELNHLDLPDGLAVPLPAHAQVVLQSHYINTTPNDIRAKDVVDLKFRDPSEHFERLGFWATSVLDLNIPPAQISTLKYKCAVEKDMKVVSLIGHMHDNGYQLSIDIGPASAVQRIYTIDQWESGFRDRPPNKTWTTSDPFQVHAGDEIDVACTWDSKATQTLHFPAEMCASNAWYFPADGSVTCMGTVLSAPGGGPDAGAP